LEAVRLESNLAALKERIAQACRRTGRPVDDITLIAVTKTVDALTIEKAFNLGIRNFGENRVQEAEIKIRALSHLQPPPAWHMIGHLQSNKVKTALELFYMVQSVDSLAIAGMLNRRAVKRLPVLLEVNIGGEQTKSGFSPSEIEKGFIEISRLANLEIKGLMTVAPPLDEAEKVRGYFRRLRELRDSFGLEHLSMGMSDDFETAIEEGATMIRIGRALFGERG
jgi:PLP dependent protein